VYFRRAASRTMRTSFLLVVPRTIESSTSTTRFPLINSRTGFSFSFTQNSGSPAKAR